MDTSELYARGLRRRKKMFGEAEVEKRMAASGEFGAPLQNIINAYVYGDIWERSGLSSDLRSLVMLGITAASNKPAEFRVHAKGALENGCTREQVQDVLLLVAMYCGIPAAIETTRIAAEFFAEAIDPAPAAKPSRNGAMKSLSTIDAHHHIWRLNDLPWLSGPQAPRIFGPYQPICRDYPIDEYRSDSAGCDVVKSIYIQTNWPAGRSYDEAQWVQSVADETGWPHANVAHADLADPDAGALLERLTKLPAVRGIRQQLHWHENPQYRFAPRPDVMNDENWRRGLAMLADHGLLFELQIFASQMADGARLARSFPDTIFVLEHAGMLEDMSPRGWQLWREGMMALAQCPNVNVKLSGLGTFVHACRDDVVGPIVSESVAMFGADRCCYGSNFPIEKLWTDYATLYQAFRNAIAHLGDDEQTAILHDTAARLYRL